MRDATRALVVVGSAVVAAASATAPQSHPDVKNTFKIRGDFDEAWNGMIDTLAEHNWNILNLDKSSGLVTTGWMTLPGDGSFYADCGSAPLANNLGAVVRFSVVLRAVDDDETKMTISTAFREARSVGDASGTVECVSIGKVEQIVREGIQGSIDASRGHRNRNDEETLDADATPVARPANVGSGSDGAIADPFAHAGSGQ